MRTEINGARLRLQFRHEDGQWVRRSYLHPHPLIQALDAFITELQKDNLKFEEPLLRLVHMFRNYIMRAEKQKGPIVSTHRTTASVLLDHGDHKHSIAEGTAYQSPTDQRDDEIGREWALLRAMEKLSDEAAEAVLEAYLRREGAKPWRVFPNDAITVLVQKVTDRISPPPKFTIQGRPFEMPLTSRRSCGGRSNEADPTYGL